MTQAMSAPFSRQGTHPAQATGIWGLLADARTNMPHCIIGDSTWVRRGESRTLSGTRHSIRVRRGQQVSHQFETHYSHILAETNYTTRTANSRWSPLGAKMERV